MKLRITNCELRMKSDGIPSRNSPFEIRHSKFTSAFTLIEVMIAMGIFFSCMFAILALVSSALRNARSLQAMDVDAGMIASQLAMTNKLYEGGDSGDFGDMYPDCRWDQEVGEASSNGLFQADFLVTRRVGQRDVQTTMSILLYRPESPPGSMSKGLYR